MTDLGFDCPKVFGDPAILLPSFFFPVSVTNKVTLGVIPHFMHKKEAEELFSGWERVKLIDVCKPIESVINEIVSCERIISSSLHGIIVSHAYGVKAAWVDFGSKLIGDSVKFYDYAEGIDHSYYHGGRTITGRESLSDILALSDKQALPELGRTKVSLLRSCPFFARKQ